MKTIECERCCKCKEVDYSGEAEQAGWVRPGGWWCRDCKVKALRDTDTSKPEVSVWAFLFGPGRRVLVSQRIKSKLAPHEYQTPGGKLEPYETPHLGIQREVCEECGINDLTFEAIPYIASVAKHATKRHSICLWFAAFVPMTWWNVELPIEKGPDGPKSGPWIWVDETQLLAMPVLAGTHEAFRAWTQAKPMTCQHFVKN